MPSWCSTTYRFRGDREELQILNEKIIEWTSSSFMETDFGDDWLGNIVIGAGFKDRIDSDEPSQTISCRGSLTDIDEITCDPHGDYYFDLWTETAWGPMAKMWDLVIESLKLKTVGFTFEAEEDGNDLYWIYDPHNYGDFSNDEVCIFCDFDRDSDKDRDDISGYYTKKDAITRLNEFFGTDFDTLEDFEPLCEQYEEEHEDNMFSVTEFCFSTELYE